jgi:bacillithiol system protein YtxJ
MIWEPLTSIEQFDQICSDSSERVYLIFKHSTRCSISSMAKNRLEKKWRENIPVYKLLYLDLISFRELSSYIAEKLAVHHESPQIIIISNQKAIYHVSHNSISVDQIVAQLG